MLTRKGYVWDIIQILKLKFSWLACSWKLMCLRKMLHYSSVCPNFMFKICWRASCRQRKKAERKEKMGKEGRIVTEGRQARKTSKQTKIVIFGLSFWFSKVEVPVQAIKVHGEVEVQLHFFLISSLDGGEGSAARMGRFTPGEKPSVPIK